MQANTRIGARCQSGPTSLSPAETLPNLFISWTCHWKTIGLCRTGNWLPNIIIPESGKFSNSYQSCRISNRQRNVWKFNMHTNWSTITYKWGTYRNPHTLQFVTHLFLDWTDDWSSFFFSYDINTPGGRFKNTYELLNQRALKFSYVNKIHIFQCMGKIFCVEFQRYPLKFHTKYLTHALKDMIFMQFWNFKSS